MEWFAQALCGSFPFSPRYQMLALVTAVGRWQLEELTFCNVG